MKKILALVLSVMMIVGAMTSLLTVSASATDDKTIDEAVAFLDALEIMQGNEDGDFMENDPVTREAAALLFARITSGYTDNIYWSGKANSTPFTDIADSSFIGAINAVYQMGIINGATTVEGIKIFNPNGGIKYQDMLVMAIRALGYSPKNSDGVETLGYPWGYIAEATKLELTVGLDGVGFEDDLTRGETAIVLYNALNTVINGSITAKNEDGDTLAKKIFKVTEDVYVLASTYNQALSGVSKSSRTEYVGLVALNLETGIPKTGSANIIWVDAKTLDLSSNPADKNAADNILGHSYTVLVKNDKVLKADINPTKTVENYGSNSAIKSFSTLANTQFITIDGITYELVNGYNDKNASYSEIVVYNSNNPSEIITSGKTLYDSMFSAVTLIDDDNDGVYDRGMYTPYSVGKYGTAGSQTTYNVTTGASQSSQTIGRINEVNTALRAYVIGSGDTLRLIRSADIIFTGEKKPAADEYVVYTWNPYTRVFYVRENLGKIKTGTIEATKKVTTTSAAASIDSSVTISGAEYKVGFNTANFATVGHQSSTGKKFTMPINEHNNSTGNVYWYDIIDSTLLGGSTTLEYLALAGRLIYAAQVDPGKVLPDFAAFDVRTDLVGVDFDGNLIVNAYVDGSGIKKQIKIDKINDIKIGSYLNTNFGLSYTSSTSGSYYAINDSIVNSILQDNLFKACFPNATAGSTTPAYLFSVVSKNLTSGVYVLTSNYSNIPGVVNTSNTTAVFSSGIINQAITASDTRSPVVLNTRFEATAATVFLFIGNDGIKLFKGSVPVDGYSIVANTTARIISANSSFVLVADNSRATTAIAPSFPNQDSSVTGQVYYMTSGATYLNSTDFVDGEIVYTYVNMYDLNARGTATVKSTTRIATDSTNRIADLIRGTVYYLNSLELKTVADRTNNNNNTSNPEYYLKKLDQVMKALGYENARVLDKKLSATEAMFSVASFSDVYANASISGAYSVYFNSASIAVFRTGNNGAEAWSASTALSTGTEASRVPAIFYYKIDSAGNATGYAFPIAYSVSKDAGDSGVVPTTDAQLLEVYKEEKAAIVKGWANVDSKDYNVAAYSAVKTAVDAIITTAFNGITIENSSNSLDTAKGKVDALLTSAARLAIEKLIGKAMVDDYVKTLTDAFAEAGIKTAITSGTSVAQAISDAKAAIDTQTTKDAILAYIGSAANPATTGNGKNLIITEFIDDISDIADAAITALEGIVDGYAADIFNKADIKDIVTNDSTLSAAANYNEFKTAYDALKADIAARKATDSNVTFVGTALTGAKIFAFVEDDNATVTFYLNGAYNTVFTNYDNTKTTVEVYKNSTATADAEALGNMGTSITSDSYSETNFNVKFEKTGAFGSIVDYTFESGNTYYVLVTLADGSDVTIATFFYEIVE